MSEGNSDEKGIPKLVRDGDLFSASDDLSVAEMQKMFPLKQNGLLQEELNWQDISFIADNLYKSGHLQLQKMEQILDRSQPRENAVDSLIDAIIGNQSAVSAFMRILESESCFSYIAERIRSTEMAWEGVLTEEKLHHPLEIWETNKILNNKRKYWTDGLDVVLLRWRHVLHDGYVLHVHVHDDGFRWFRYVHDVLLHDVPCEYPAAQKRMKMQENDSVAVKEKKMVKSLRIAIVGQKSWSQVGKHQGREFKEAYKGPFEDEE